MVLLWCWLIGCTLLLSAARSKMVTYVWPVFPPVAILAAVGWVRLIEGTLSPAARRMLRSTFVVSCVTGPVVLPAALLVVRSEFALRFSWAVWTVVCLAAAGAVAPLCFWLAGRLRAALVAAMISVAVQFAVIMTAVLPSVAATASARELAGHFNRLGQMPPQLLVAEERIGSLVFYLHPRLRHGLSRDRLRQVHLAELGDAHPGTVVALPERQVHRAGRGLDLRRVAYRQVGRYRLYQAEDLKARLRTAVAEHERAKRR
jgi:hypothetical protein